MVFGRYANEMSSYDNCFVQLSRQFNYEFKSANEVYASYVYTKMKKINRFLHCMVCLSPFLINESILLEKKYK